MTWVSRSRRTQNWTLLIFKAHKKDPRIADVVKDMAEELGTGNTYPDMLERMAQYELTLLDWAEANIGASRYFVFANKCWPAFPNNLVLSYAMSTAVLHQEVFR